MTKQKRRKQKKPYGKKLIFERPANIKVENLLELYMKIIGDLDVNLDIKFDRVSIEISGDKKRVDDAAIRIRRIQGQTEKASITDNEGFYHYERDIITKVSKHQIQLEYLVDCLIMKGFNSSLSDDKTVITTAAMEDLRSIQINAQQAIFSVPGNQNRDIQRFLALIHLKTGHEYQFIIDIATEYDVFGEDENRLYFKQERDIAMPNMLDILKSDSFDETIPISSPDDIELISDLGFDGGKIVFVGDEQELEHSTYDRQENA